jgi:hypothetical protein
LGQRHLRFAVSHCSCSICYKLWSRGAGAQLNPLCDDKFIWKWSANQQYSASSAYRGAFFHGQSSVPGAKQLSKSRAPPRCKFFMWAVLLSRCWTADRHHRHQLQDNDRCSLCSQVNETVTHLLLNCSYSKEVWFRILRRSGHHSLTPDQESSVADWWLPKRKCVHKDQPPGFDSVVILVCWCIWKERNRRTFEHRSSLAHVVADLIIQEARLWSHAGFSAMSDLVQ